MKLAAHFNKLARELAPQVCDYMKVPANLTTRFEIEEYLRSQGEYIEGMAQVIITLAEKAVKEAA